MEIYEKIPESAKVTTALGPAALGLFGIPLEQWILILSAIVSILIIIEKIPKAYNAIAAMVNKFRGKDVNNTE